MDYLIVSAATLGSRYAQCIEAQRDHYQRHKYLGMVVADQGDWYENTKIKPAAIRRGFEQSPVVMWIDADCSIDPPAGLPPGEWDICTLHNIHPRHKLKTSAAFILLKDTLATASFLNTWESLNRHFKKDHPAMIKTLAVMGGSLKVADMSHWLHGRHTINAFAPERGVFEG